MTLDQMKDKDIGKIGIPERDKYELDLRLEVLDEMIKCEVQRSNKRVGDHGSVESIKL